MNEFNVFTFLKDFLGNNYNIIISLVCLICLFYAIIMKIKYNCLNRASEFVAMVEENKKLSGETKFKLVKSYIEKEMVFAKSKLFTKTLNNIIQFAYDTSKQYTVNYIKKKTGCDISEIVKIIEDNKTKEIDEMNNGIM